MLTKTSIVRCVGSAIVLLANVADAAPLEAYARLPLYENVAISPDGTKAAFVTTIGDQREVVVQPLAASIASSGSGISRLKAGPQKLRDLNWAGNDQLLITISQSRDFLAGSQSESFALSNFDLKRKSAFSPMMWVDESKNNLARAPISRVIDGKAILFLHNHTMPRRGDYNALGYAYMIPALYRSDLQAQTTSMIDGAPGSDAKKYYQWTIDSRGTEILQSVYDEDSKTWSLSIKRNDNWQVVYSEAALIEAPTVVGLALEDNMVLVKKQEHGEWVLRRFSLLDGKWGETLAEEGCGSTYLTDPLTDRVVGCSWFDSRRHYHFFDTTMKSTWDQVIQSFPGEEVQLESWSDGMRKMIVLVFGKTTGAAYLMIDLVNKQMSRLGNFYAGIEAVDIATVKPFSYDAADGTHIGGYLTFPSGKSSKNLPLVVLPHGGPAARDELRFDWFAQALASKGYLVLQPNFRGSRDLGYKFQEAGYGEWGRKMQTDLSDGVRALVKIGIVDPARVCIAGMSYGGYAALAGVTLEPDIYRCAISIAGIAELRPLFYEAIDVSVSNDNRALRYDLRYVGATKLSDPVLAERSPVNYVDKVKSPILLIHGDNDSVVPIEQSQIMANALKKAGKPYEFVKLKSEDHWLSKADTRLQMLQAVVKFLEANNPP